MNLNAMYKKELGGLLIEYAKKKGSAAARAAEDEIGKAIVNADAFSRLFELAKDETFHFTFNRVYIRRKAESVMLKIPGKYTCRIKKNSVNDSCVPEYLDFTFIGAAVVENNYGIETPKAVREAIAAYWSSLDDTDERLNVITAALEKAETSEELVALLPEYALNIKRYVTKNRHAAENDKKALSDAVRAVKKAIGGKV